MNTENNKIDLRTPAEQNKEKSEAKALYENMVALREIESERRRNRYSMHNHRFDGVDRYEDLQ